MLSRILATFFASLIIITVLSCSDYTNSRPSYDIRASSEGQGGLTSNPLPPELLNPNTGDFSETKMLVNIGLNVLSKNTQKFSLESSLLKMSISDYCDELDGGSNPTEFENDAKKQWEDAMLAFHTMDSAPVGPMSDNDKSLLVNIYAWPILNTCAVDTKVAQFSNGEPAVVPNEINARGLAALEYLLFDSTFKTKCKKSNKIVLDWSNKTLEQKKVDRCKAALVLAQDIEKQARRVEAAWDPDGANFTKTLIDGSRFASLKSSINAVTDSLFSIEKIKDDKLAKALGLHADCTSDTLRCPEMAEHQWSGLALRAIEAQLRGFKAVFYGSNVSKNKGFGFDDYLNSVAQTKAAENIERVIDEALVNVQALDKVGTLQSQIETMDAEQCRATTYQDAKVPVCHLFQQVREIVTDLKKEVLLTLSLTAPPAYQGDMD